MPPLPLLSTKGRRRREEEEEKASLLSGKRKRKEGKEGGGLGRREAGRVELGMETGGGDSRRQEEERRDRKAESERKEKPGRSRMDRTHCSPASPSLRLFPACTHTCVLLPFLACLHRQIFLQQNLPLASSTPIIHLCACRPHKILLWPLLSWPYQCQPSIYLTANTCITLALFLLCVLLRARLSQLLIPHCWLLCARFVISVAWQTGRLSACV